MSAAPAQAKKSPQAASGASKNPHRLTAKQIAADRANLAKARAKERKLPRTAKQIAASRRNLVKARAAQRHRKKQAGSKKTAQAPLSTALDLHSLPVCAPVALAAHLQAWTGVVASTAEIWDLWLRAGETTLETTLEAATEHGLAGRALAGFWPADPLGFTPWLVYGVQLAIGYHAVLAGQDVMHSWGLVLPLTGRPEEAWHLEWADD